ncbi:dienelactone hydrolase family protein [Sphingomonas oryzagri]|uniref:Dienelactone hydrolase family protein n=1 Tax=Sphingomonas oryzagri TaxID=3042314 RepID=A0ABT6N3G2_9SPHN|nr:dienelactone hydrolase family protein [Sphingomonas oryzagri]MDH7639304.1 dienelactone hydrolase family protein [Sphingomonas oryzagri]
MKTIEVATRDGTMPLHVHIPAGAGPWPGVLMFMDGPGMRPAVHELAERLAQSGYCVLLPDLFYRSGSYEPVDPKVVFTDLALREQHREKFMALATPRAVMADTEALLAAVEGLPELADGRIGVVGYCMGGRFALIAAGTFPDRIAAAASYHGGGLANDTPTSPHLLAPKVTAKVYVAGAIEDANFDDAQKQRLIDALVDAGVDHLVETYPAKHGWVPSDMPVHDPAEAEHHWRTLIPLMDGALKP